MSVSVKPRDILSKHNSEFDYERGTKIHSTLPISLLHGYLLDIISISVKSFQTTTDLCF